MIAECNDLLAKPGETYKQQRVSKRKDKKMQIIGVILLMGILMLLLGGCLYLANRQKPKKQHYGSWSQVLGPQFNGSAMDVGEKLNEEISVGQRRSLHTRQNHRARSKKRQ
jgi:hypothetical protein